jgi:hypothetical protein
MGPEGPEKHREIGEVEAGSEGVRIVAAQATRLALEKWKGYCAASLLSLGMTTVDEYVYEVRGH